METKELAILLEILLKAQVGAIRKYLKEVGPSESKEKKPSRTSHIKLVKDVLQSVDKPMHITEILHEVHERYGITLDRDSMVSGLTKKVHKGVMFVRTAPSTFALKKDLA
jgi:hypothetical protein